jgi:uncharacterized membrane protein
MRWWAVVASVVIVAYPLLVYGGMQWLEPRYLGLILAGFYALRLLIVSRKPGVRILLLVAIAGGGLALWLFNSEILLRLVPGFINIGLALGFGYTLFYPPTLPARMARLQHGFLTPAMETYTTRITCLWVGFFVLNATLAIITALWASREVWALYNGLIAYGLIGLLFVAEYSYRRLVFFKKHHL